MPEVLVFVEQRDGKVKSPSLQAVSEGRKLADAWKGSLEAVLVGTGLDEAAARVLAFGPDRVTVLEHADLGTYSAEGFTNVVADRIRAVNPQAVLFPATAMGKDLAPRIAAKFATGLASDCIDLEAGSDRSLVVRRPVFSGKAIATVEFSEARPMMATLRPNVFPLGIPAEKPGGEVVREKPALDAARNRTRTVEILQQEGVELDVTEAEIVVSGGRSLKNSENFSIIRDLARALGGAVGASRAAVDAGYIAHQHQVGQTGKVVSPKLYIACGISGAIQHLAGMTSSKVIVAINKDKEAPIFKLADYGIVGDLFQIVPLLTEKIRKLKAE